MTARTAKNVPLALLYHNVCKGFILLPHALRPVVLLWEAHLRNKGKIPQTSNSAQVSEYCTLLQPVNPRALVASFLRSPEYRHISYVHKKASKQMSNGGTERQTTSLAITTTAVSKTTKQRAKPHARTATYKRRGNRNHTRTNRTNQSIPTGRTNPFDRVYMIIFLLLA